jgi:hypothetical protein
MSATVVADTVGPTEAFGATTASDAVGTALEATAALWADDSLPDVPQPATDTNINRSIPDRLARTKRIVPARRSPCNDSTAQNDQSRSALEQSALAIVVASARRNGQSVRDVDASEHIAGVDNSEQARLAHLNMVEAFALLPGYLPNGFVKRADGVVVAATGSPMAFFNEVLPVADRVEPVALVDAVQTLGQAGLAGFVHLRDIDDALVPVLQDLGLEEEVEDYPAMVLTPMPAALDFPAGFEVARVTNPAEFDVHLRTAAVIAGIDPDLNATWLGPGIVDDPAAALFVGYAEGTPIATSMSIHTAHVNGIYNVGVSEAARRRGYGWAMTLAAIMAGVQAGCTIATLQSSPMGYPLYAAHGFRTLFNYRRFRCPAPSAP